MVKNLPETVNDKYILPKYQKLIMLKKAVTMSEDDEVNEQILLDRAIEHNEREIYLIGYLVETVMKAPKELQKQFDALISCYDNPSEYTKVYKQTQKMFRTNPKFRRFEAKICANLDLFAPFNCKVTNLTIFGLCHELISTTVQLEPRNIVMNLHILQKWLSMQKKINLAELNINEKKVVLYLANGYIPKEIIENGVIKCESVERLRMFIYKVLPTHFGVKYLCQVMAIIYANNLELVNIQAAMRMLENLCE